MFDNISGLTGNEAETLLKQFGYNELPTEKPKNFWHIALEVVREPMFILLLCCGAVYLILGDYSEGFVLLSWVLIIIFITFYQHRKTEKSLEVLRQLSAPRALVIRDGQENRITGREVVPGDVIILSEGDRVPADAVVLESNHLTLDESLLTGESIPVVKNSEIDGQSNLFSGTLVVQGRGIAKVVTTGIETQFGKIGSSLGAIDKSETRLQGEIKVMIRNLFIAGAVISIGVITAFYLSRGNFLESLLNGLAAAMALLPEEFPVVMTIFLALGAWRLSKNKVLTRTPSAIETLGSATVLCSDKTGTITQNRMMVAALFNGRETYIGHAIRDNRANVEEVVEVLFFASQKDTIDPMEKAIIIEYSEHKIQKSNPTLLKEYPLSKELFAMTRVMKSEENGDTFAYCKGAPEAVFKLCALSEEETQKQLEVVHQFAQKGYRVIAAAKSSCEETGLPATQQGFDFTLVGLVGFEDPVRDEVPQAISECYEAGIRVIMITGDYPATALSIAEQIGLPHSGQILTGQDLQQMSEEELKIAIRNTSVFARIIPEQKLQIIQALKANGEIVAMTGDGVNDAPALKAADIGVAMGLKGTDVAREASSLVLLDDNFASIVGAIRSGRKIFDNLQKAISYVIAIHIPIIGLVLLPAFFSSLPILLMPLHIVFMELIIDPVCSVAFESEQEEKGIMKRPPRNPEKRFFGWNKLFFSLFKGMLLLAMVIGVYFIAMKEGHSPGEVRAIAFSALIIGNVFLILTSLSKTRSFIAVIKEKKLIILLIPVLALLMLLLTISLPFLQKVFNFEFPGYQHFVVSLVGAVLMLGVLEIVKIVKMRKRARH